MTYHGTFFFIVIACSNQQSHEPTKELAIYSFYICDKSTKVKKTTFLILKFSKTKVKSQFIVITICHGAFFFIVIIWTASTSF
jgi:hypothetical protein